jgi:hypothetical protein
MRPTPTPEAGVALLNTLPSAKTPLCVMLKFAF